MMQRFTFKDFINYNNPCLICGKATQFSLISYPFTYDFNSSNEIGMSIICEMRDKKLFCVLQHYYRDSLTLEIDPRTNRFEIDTKLTNGEESLVDYLQGHKLCAELYCPNCFTMINSNQLSFNFSDSYVIPFSLFSERVILKNNDEKYVMVSYFDSPAYSYLHYFNGNDDEYNLYFGQTDGIQLPITPLSSFNTKSDLLNKLRTYITLS